MEKKRSSEERIKKMQELGIFGKRQADTDARTGEREVHTIRLPERPYKDAAARAYGRGAAQDA